MQEQRYKRFKAAFTEDLQQRLEQTFEDKAKDLFARDGNDEKKIDVKGNPELQRRIRKIFQSYIALFYEAQTYNPNLSADRQILEHQYNRWVYKRYTGLAFKQLKAAASLKDPDISDGMVMGLYGSLIRRTCETFQDVFPVLKLPTPCISGSEILMPWQYQTPRQTRDSIVNYR